MRDGWSAWCVGAADAMAKARGAWGLRMRWQLRVVRGGSILRARAEWPNLRFDIASRPDGQFF